MIWLSGLCAFGVPIFRDKGEGPGGTDADNGGNDQTVEKGGGFG